jgi:hypothetical protein
LTGSVERVEVEVEVEVFPFPFPFPIGVSFWDVRVEVGISDLIGIKRSAMRKFLFSSKVNSSPFNKTEPVAPLPLWRLYKILSLLWLLAREISSFSLAKLSLSYGSLWFNW